VARRWGSSGVQRSLPGAAALGACGGGEVTASGHCRRALVSSRRLETCREAEGKGEGSGPFPLFLPGLSGGVRAGEAVDRQHGALQVRR
jgi:hypothetical protein